MKSVQTVTASSAVSTADANYVRARAVFAHAVVALSSRRMQIMTKTETDEIEAFAGTDGYWHAHYLGAHARAVVDLFGVGRYMVTTTDQNL